MRASYSDVPNHDIARPTYTQSPFDPARFHSEYSVVAVKDKHTLELSWMLPDLTDRYRCMATEYVAEQLGHEATGSVLSFLKKRGWATSLEAGCSWDGYERTSAGFLFQCKLILTDDGFMHHRDECIAVRRDGGAVGRAFGVGQE